MEWAIAALNKPAAETPIRVALGNPALDDQGLLVAYWLSQPRGTVVVDGDCLLFCNLARWFVLSSELQVGPSLCIPVALCLCAAASHSAPSVLFRCTICPLRITLR